MTASPKKPQQSTSGSNSYTGLDKELNTQSPLSEKDEVKKAEDRMAKSTKKTSK